ncbi:MAG: c-type cytochrome [Caldilineaceae bacterium]|nr:c-type cytochrome [Caldilineaceae bacterium]
MRTYWIIFGIVLFLFGLSGCAAEEENGLSTPVALYTPAPPFVLTPFDATRVAIGDEIIIIKATVAPTVEPAVEPTLTPEVATPAPVATDTPVASPTPTETAVPVATATPIPTATPTPTERVEPIIIEEAESELPPNIAAALAQANPVQGEQLILSNGCTACHSMQPGVVQVGPSWYNLAGHAETRVEGQSAELYLYNSIVHPNDYIVEGFMPNLMPQLYEATLTDQQIAHMIAYMLTLRGEE